MKTVLIVITGVGASNFFCLNQSRLKAMVIYWCYMG